MFQFIIEYSTCYVYISVYILFLHSNDETFNLGYLSQFILISWFLLSSLHCQVRLCCFNRLSATHFDQRNALWDLLFDFERIGTENGAHKITLTQHYVIFFFRSMRELFCLHYLIFEPVATDEAVEIFSLFFLNFMEKGSNFPNFSV